MENLEELITNKKTLEKFAREKYLMKKPDEEIFIFVEKEKVCIEAIHLANSQ